VTPDYAKASRALSRRDAVLKAIIQKAGPCTLVPEPCDTLTSLVRCVIYQQISTFAARTIFMRLVSRLGGTPFDRQKLAELDAAELRACGISAPKQRTIQAVLQFATTHPETFANIPTQPDNLIASTLTQIKGIGPWSVDMYMMFGLGRLDVWPVGDLGIRIAVERAWGLPDRPGATELQTLAEPWRPYRTVAAWYLWQSLGGVIPQSGQGG
jgi:DNA-3-methyladenine glycosylase II